MRNGKFWADALERAVSTAAETALAFIVVGSTGLLDLDWAAIGSVSGAAAVATVLKALAASKVGSSDSASLTR